MSTQITRSVLIVAAAFTVSLAATPVWAQSAADTSFFVTSTSIGNGGSEVIDFYFFHFAVFTLMSLLK